MSLLYQQVLANPGDGAVWRELADGFCAQGRAGRAVACLDAWAANRPEARSDVALESQADRSLRRRAAREAVERRRALFASLAAPDEARISAIVVGRPGCPETERTRRSLLGQSVDPDTLEIRVVRERSEGLKLATGRYVAHLDAGDELFPDHLALLADHLDRTGRAMTFSRALRPGPDRPQATDGAPVLPRQATRSEFVPSACVLHRRRVLRETGGFEPHLGRGQAWHLWNRFVDRMLSDAVPVISARVAGPDVIPERRFDLLLVRLGSEARARRFHRRARTHLTRGDAELAAQDLGRAWNLGLSVETFLPAIAAISEHSRRSAAELVALGAGEVEPHLRGAFRRIARGAQARRTLALRVHRHALRTLYRDEDRRGSDHARSYGWREETSAAD